MKTLKENENQQQYRKVVHKFLLFNERSPRHFTSNAVVYVGLLVRMILGAHSTM